MNTILDVSKIEAGLYTIQRDDFCFAAAVNESVALVREQAKKKNISINERFLPNIDSVFADRRAVKQMLINLLTNAVKYTENGGFITIDACFDDGRFTFEISDTGIGMTANELAQIGKPFSQVDSTLNRTNEGTGLGLSLVKGLVELHNGKMTIHSMPNIGTRVSVSIPNDCVKENVINKTNSKLVTLTTLLPKQINSDETIQNKEINRNERKIG
ncbi:MAG: HAMP domain-containing sensor histidine kinase [Ahrensia sp.]|nr:HAMP domain-containing sensor histidine kinase [Ahrensia sp.]